MEYSDSTEIGIKKIENNIGKAQCFQNVMYINDMISCEHMRVYT